ncbi:hypothetical protein HU200_028689 [Digitaria exilis]|uniref:Uncharacterized protein n=1 Tax=Digitaria exilis TaxID=1010633 RepID=A0A835BVM7_9POAL|nr:hypothetical protein HU200_028689 [Digitaria exilis]
MKASHLTAGHAWPQAAAAARQGTSHANTITPCLYDRRIVRSSINPPPDDTVRAAASSSISWSHAIFSRVNARAWFVGFELTTSGLARNPLYHPTYASLVIDLRRLPRTWHPPAPAASPSLYRERETRRSRGREREMGEERKGGGEEEAATAAAARAAEQARELQDEAAALLTRTRAEEEALRRRAAALQGELRRLRKAAAAVAANAPDSDKVRSPCVSVGRLEEIAPRWGLAAARLGFRRWLVFRVPCRWVAWGAVALDHRGEICSCGAVEEDLDRATCLITDGDQDTW